MTRRWPLAALVVVLVAETAVVAVLTRHSFPHRTLWLEGITTPLFLLAVALLRVSRLPVRHGLLLVVGAGAVLQIFAMTGRPISSDDDYRYLWDAKVQLSGTDPYRYAPAATELEHLRDGYLFPDNPSCARDRRVPDGCTVINRPSGRTIYPPVAQLAFDTFRILSFGGNGNHLPLEIGGALGAVALAVLLARRGLPPWQVAIWSWCPVTVIELGNNAHIDWLGALFAVLALLAYRERHPIRGGLLLGAAAATKLYPALVGAAMLRRRPVLVVGAAVGLLALSYVPHVLAVGTDVVGYLPKYLQDEQYVSGGRFLLFFHVAGDSTVKVLIVGLLAVTGLLVAWRSDPEAPECGALVMVAVAMALTTPGQGWYSVLLIALIAMTGRFEVLPLALVPTLVYLVDGDFGGVALDRDARYYRWATALTLVGLVAHFSIRRVRRSRAA